MTPAERLLELPGGLRLPCVEQGDAQGLPVLLLHGVTDSWRSFTPLLPLLPDTWRVVAVTQRGHRGASQPADGYGIGDLAGDAAAVLDALGIASAAVVGHSMGGAVAQRLAIEQPARVRSLVVMGSFSALARNPVVHDLYAAVSALRDPVDRGFVHDFQASTVARPLPPAFLDLVVGESLHLPARVWQALFTGFLADDAVADLARIGAPTTIIWGDADTICPSADQQTLAAAIPDARLVVLPGTGHAVHWDDPQAVAHALRAALGHVTL